MTSRNPKGTVLDQRHYESSDVISQFEPLRDQLLADLRSHDPSADITLTSQDLSVFLWQLQRFQQDHLGVLGNHSDDTVPLRIPAKLFKLDPAHTKKKKAAKKTKKHLDLDDTHPIYTILLAAYRYRLDHHWQQWDFTNKDTTMQLIHHVRTALLDHGFLTPPRIAFGPSVPSAAKKALTPLVRRVGGTVVSTDPSHILHGPMHSYEDMEEDWFRTLEKQDNKVLVHWWYYPDSYDSWLTQTAQFADPEDAPEHTGHWNLTCRWLQDAIKFNELMNEEDYEDVDPDYMNTVPQQQEDAEEEDLEEDDEDDEDDDEEDDDDDEMDTPSVASNHTQPSAAAPTPAVRLSIKRKASDSYADLQSTYDDDGGDPVHSMELPVLDPLAQPLVRVRDVEVEQPLLGSRQRKNEFEPYMNGDISNISQYTPQNMQLFPADPTETTDDLSSLCYAGPQDYAAVFVPDWFDFDKIDPVEKLALPEFFKEDHGTLYTKYRNYMVKTYQANPASYLTVAACKDAFPDADLVALVRLHSFLELYHVINGQMDPRHRVYQSVIDGEPEAYADLHPDRRPSPPEKIDIQYLRKLMYDPVKSRKTCTHWDIKADETNTVDGTKVHRCQHCHVDCTALRYQCVKWLSLSLCVDCFVQGRFTSVYSSSDFLRVDETVVDQDIDEEWTDEETLLLLEGVDRYDDDWLMVSEHVGSRTKEQCITQFLQMPITDDLLTDKLSNKEMDELPFGNTTNPIMTLVAYLSAHINPGVASAAAKAALKELMAPQDDDDDNDNDDDESSVFTKKATQHATLAALRAAAIQALKLSHYEDQEIQHWTRLAVKTVTDKLAMKIQQYEDFDRILEADNQEMENQLGMLQTTLEGLRKQHFEVQPATEPHT